MVQSINTKVDLTMAGTSYMGLSDYGKIMIGDKGFEFFNDRDVRKYIQIPWEEVDVVIASVMFKGKWIPRFALRTNKNGMFTFSAKNSKEVLELLKLSVRKYNQTLIMITHDPSIALQADRVITIEDGTIKQDEVI